MKKIVFSALLLVIISGCSKYQSDDVLLKEIDKAMQPVVNGKNVHKIISLDSLTTFPWDSVYIFHAEERADFISAFIKISWDGPDVPNQHSRLLFVHKGKVVSYVDYNEEGIDVKKIQSHPLPIYLYICSNSGNRNRILSKKNARFVTFRFCRNNIVHYPFLPIKCLELKEYRDMLKKSCNK